MKNQYNYVDPDYTYTDPKTGELRNSQNITDYKILLSFESINASTRLEELKDKPIAIKDANALLDIHYYLFQDVYEWAGKIRTVEISKQGKQFFTTLRFREAFTYIDSLIADYRKIETSDIKGIANFLAIILDSINYLHPFREGNGRTQREFLRVLALEKGFEIDLNPPDNPGIYERYMSGTIDGDIPKLQDLLLELMNYSEGN
ncbi:cell division protein Fic [Spirochaetia bacterium]|nr:cell division protein Fic [Spirochaetia bacterium]